MTTPTTPCQAFEKLREAAMDVMIPLAAWKLNDEQEQYREIGPTMRATLIAAHDKLLAALFLPCSCGTEKHDLWTRKGCDDFIAQQKAVHEPAPTPPTDDLLDTSLVPDNVRNAAQMIVLWFEVNGYDNWQFFEIADRKLVIKLERELAEAQAQITSAKSVLWSNLDRDREELSLQTLANLASNAIYWRDMQINKLKTTEQPRWIPYSERAPTEEDGCKLWGMNPTKYVMRLSDVIQPVSIYTVYGTGYWCRIVLPPEPEPTPFRVDPDEAAFEKWRTSKPASNEPITQYDLREAWRAALVHARGESK